MRELSRFDLAIIKRTAKNTKALVAKRDKLQAMIKKNQEELDTILATIEKFEAPIKEMTGGFTSEQVLNGEAEVANVMSDAPEGSIDGTATVEEIEIPASEVKLPDSEGVAVAAEEAPLNPFA
jgi:hypothetical protein